MGRPREFDIDAALQVATEIFWKKGYDATSLHDLTSAIDITPPSFYFAFQSKEALFRQVVARYQALQAKIVEKALRQPTPAEVVEFLLKGFADLFTDRRHAVGCLILNSALPVTENHPFRNCFAEQRKALRRKLQNRFDVLNRAHTQKPGSLDSAALSHLVVSLLWGIAVEAQSGASRKQINKTIATVVSLCRQAEVRKAA